MSTTATYLNDELYAYLCEVSLREHAVLQELRKATAKLSTSQMQVAPEEGQFLSLLVRLIGARKTLEVGVYTGYSSLCVALALPDDGQMVVCDVNEEWTQLARTFWAKAGVEHKIDLQLRPALETLHALIAQKQQASFDFMFIDADKGNFAAYYELGLELIRPGGLIVFDNVLLRGAVADPKDLNPSTLAIRELNEALLKDDRVYISLLPVADGITLAMKK